MVCPMKAYRTLDADGSSRRSKNWRREANHALDIPVVHAYPRKCQLFPPGPAPWAPAQPGSSSTQGSLTRFNPGNVAICHKAAEVREVSMTRAVVADARDNTTRRRHGLLEDLGPFITATAVLLLMGTLLLIAAIESPSILQWTGTSVPAVERGGLAYYSFHGQTYALDVTTPLVQSGTVYLDPVDPSNAMLANPVSRWIDVSTVGGPYAASVLLLTLGFARRSRRRRLRWRGPGARFGDTTLTRLLELQRRRDWREGDRQRP